VYIRRLHAENEPKCYERENSNKANFTFALSNTRTAGSSRHRWKMIPIAAKANLWQHPSTAGIYNRRLRLTTSRHSLSEYMYLYTIYSENHATLHDGLTNMKSETETKQLSTTDRSAQSHVGMLPTTFGGQTDRRLQQSRQPCCRNLVTTKWRERAKLWLENGACSSKLQKSILGFNFQ